MEANSILISAEFVIGYRKNKVGEEKFDIYPIELVVDRDITLNDLKAAIENGLRLKCESSKLKAYIASASIPESDVKSISISVDLDSKSDIPSKVKERDEAFMFIKCKYAFDTCVYKVDDKTPNAVVTRGSINPVAITDTEVLANADRLRIEVDFDKHGNEKLYELGFITSARLTFDISGRHASAFIIEESKIGKAFRESFPSYNISSNPMYSLNTEPIRIIPPSEPPKKRRQNIIMSLLSPILMMTIMVIVRMFFMQGASQLAGGIMVIMTIAMGGVTILMAIGNIFFQSRDHKKELSEWKEQYEKYVKGLMQRIEKQQSDDKKLLEELQPSIEKLIEKTQRIDGSIFSRSQSHPDFLAVRLGKSSNRSILVKSVFEIVGERKDVVFASAGYKNLHSQDFEIDLPNPKDSSRGLDSYLCDLPRDIAHKYEYLDDAPVMLRLNDCGVLGIVSQDGKSSYGQLITDIIFELCFYHSPDNLQFVMFCEENRDWNVIEDNIYKYKHLPHFHELLEGISSFAFNKQDANIVLNKLLELINLRKENVNQGSDSGIKHPHIVVVLHSEYELKRHPISEYLIESHENNNAHGITFIFCKKYEELLPEYCGHVIKIEKGNHILMPHTLEPAYRSSNGADSSSRKKSDNLHDVFNITTRYAYKPYEIKSYRYRETKGSEDTSKKLFRKDLYNAFKILSAIYYTRITQNSDIPTNYDLSDLYKGVSNLKIEDYWMDKRANTDITKSLSVFIGIKNKTKDETQDGIEVEELVKLDLHEKGDGPHMLVAGTTGSGKSETIITYLIGLCVKYTPKEVNLLLVDMKGGGFIKRIGDLPHVVGKVTDVDGDENGTGAEYMLKRFLDSLAAEVKRRKMLLNKMGVDSLDGYINAFKNVDKHIESLRLDKHSDAEKILTMRTLVEDGESLPHLFLVIDEFTELKRFSAESNDVDFISEITTIARVGRSLGFHIILISQNIEGAITEDIRINSRAKLCLKVATRQASQEMIGTDLAASPLMPGNGRAYLLVGNGARFDYFQSAYSGASVNKTISRQIIVIHAEKSGRHSQFYDSHEDNPEIKAKKKKIKLDSTQLQQIVRKIIKYNDDVFSKKHSAPYIVFTPPLSSKYIFENGKAVDISKHHQPTTD